MLRKKKKKSRHRVMAVLEKSELYCYLRPFYTSKTFYLNEKWNSLLKLRLRSSFRWKFFKKSVVELYSELITFRHFKKFFQNKKVPLYIWHHKIRYNWPNFELQVPFFSWNFLFNDITWRWLRKICCCAIQARLAMETAGLQPPPNNFVFSLIGITSTI